MKYPRGVNHKEDYLLLATTHKGGCQLMLGERDGS